MTPCPIETTFAEYRFACELRAGHDGPHAWWLAEPCSLRWTTDLLIEDHADDPEVVYWPRSI